MQIATRVTDFALFLCLAHDQQVGECPLHVQVSCIQRRHHNKLGSCFSHSVPHCQTAKFGHSAHSFPWILSWVSTYGRWLAGWLAGVWISGHYSSGLTVCLYLEWLSSPINSLGPVSCYLELDLSRPDYLHMISRA